MPEPMINKRNLQKSLEAWENMSDEDTEALNKIPPYIVHHMSRLAFYAKKYLESL